jgi:hypothetical protein
MQAFCWVWFDGSFVRNLFAQATRFANDVIYTYTGPILLAVNPFQRLPLYTKEASVVLVPFLHTQSRGVLSGCVVAAMWRP